MRLELSTTLPVRLPRLLDELADPHLLWDLASPMLVFEPIGSGPGSRWTLGAHRFRLLVGGKVPLGEHTIDVASLSRDPADLSEDGIVWHDAGHSPLIKVWDHRIRLVKLSGGGTRYTDLVEIHAGALTAPAWLFARAFYAHRQRRLWRRAAAWARHPGRIEPGR